MANQKLKKRGQAGLPDTDGHIIWTPKSVIKKHLREIKFKSKKASNDVTAVRFSRGAIVMTFKDGRVLSTPLSMHPTLQGATPGQRRKFQILAGGELIWWYELQYEMNAARMLNPFGPCC